MKKSNKDKSAVIATSEGRLYIKTVDFFKQEKIIKTIRKLKNSKIVKQLDSRFQQKSDI